MEERASRGASKEEILQWWREHLRSFSGNHLEIIEKPIEKNINGQLDIKLGQFTDEELNVYNLLKLCTMNVNRPNKK